MPDEPDGLTEETLRLREETQRLIDVSREERRLCELLVAQTLAILPRIIPADDGGSDLVTQHLSG